MRQFFCIVCEWLILSKDRNQQLCSQCLGKVKSKETLVHRRFHEEGVPHYFLFEWGEESDYFCKRVVYFLKNKSERYFRSWAQHFGAEMQNREVSGILVPQSGEAGDNHALSFAQNLQKLYPNSCVIEVELSGDGPQKRKTRKERRSFKRCVVSQLSSDLKDSNWVFVDDVFVTGSTYETIRCEMGAPPKSIVTLFYRSLWERGENLDDA